MMRNKINKVSLIALFQSVLLYSAFAGVTVWRGGVGIDATEWEDVANWDQGLPDQDDHVVVHNYSAYMPVIDSDVGQIRYLTPSWHDGITSSLTINPGGKLRIIHNTILGHGASSLGQLIMNGGELEAWTLRVGEVGDGNVVLAGGRLYAEFLEWGQEVGSGTGNINIGAGRLVLPDDQTVLMASYVADGRITAYAGTGRVYYDFHNTTVGCTTVMATENLGKAYRPVPGHQRTELDLDAGLGWSKGDAAVSHDVYVGTDWSAVTGADISDATGIYRGRVVPESFDPGAFQPDTVYYWRTDEVAAGEVITQGDVWEFRTRNPKPARDLYSDTWVAADALGRKLPEVEQCGDPRENKVVGIYYVTFLRRMQPFGPHNNTEIIAANPQNPAFNYAEQLFFWAEPEAGYYLPDDEWVLRRNISMLTDAGVDVLIMEATNGPIYVHEFLKLCEVLQRMKDEGYDTNLKVCVWAYNNSPPVLRAYYEQVYSKGLYSDLWFQWEGKPLILGLPDGGSEWDDDVNYDNTPVSQEIRDFFTWRSCWYDVPDATLHRFWQSGEAEDVVPSYSWDEATDRAEEIPVSPAGHANFDYHGKSAQNGVQPPLNEYDLPVDGTEGHGIRFAEQWERALEVDPEFIFLSEWNEWQHLWIERKDGDPPVYFFGEWVPVGGYYTVDLYNAEFTRDIAPMKGGYTDNYYYQMSDGIRRYKGVRPPREASAPQTILVDGSFSDWANVEPEFRDTLGDTFHRNHYGYAYSGPYVNTSGRNDLLDMKVARDTAYIYFYAKTRDPLTPYTDPNWMMLFIDADQNSSTGWEGYDYLINRSPSSAMQTTLEQTSSGWNWNTVSTGIEYAASGNEIEIRVPRALIGQGGGFEPVALDFHWADNIQADDDIIQFALNGDSAPNRRFNYRYQTREPVGTTLYSNGFETGQTLGDWDITTAEAFSGTHALECSEDDEVGLVVHNVPTAGQDGFRVSFKYKLQNVDSGILLYYHDGTQWVFLEDLGSSENDVWLQYTDVRLNSGNDARFFGGTFHFHIQGSSSVTAPSQFVWIDDLEIIGYTHPEPPPPTPEESYGMWAGTFGMDTNGSGAMMFDADGDGLDNLAEYGLGTDPVLSDADAIGITAELSPSSIIYSYPRRLYAADLGLDYELAYKTSLTNTDWLPLGYTWETGTNSIDPYFETITNEIPIDGEEQGFFHLELRVD